MIPSKTGIVCFLLIFCFFLASIRSLSTENYLSGSRFAGMANASVMIPDVWSAFHNQAGLGFLQYTSLSVHHENRFILPQYGLSALALAVPTKPGTLGASFSYFGYSQYHELKAGLSFSRQFFKNYSFGVQVNYHSVFISQSYGRALALSVEGGILAQPIDNLFIGVHIFNPTRSAYNSQDGIEKLPVIFRLGIGYHLKDRIWFGVETLKRTGFREEWKLGLEIEAIQHLFLRGGLGNNPLHNTFGFGYSAFGFTGDLAFSFHPQLGFSPHFTITYTIR